MVQYTVHDMFTKRRPVWERGYYMSVRCWCYWLRMCCFGPRWHHAVLLLVVCTSRCSVADSLVVFSFLVLYLIYFCVLEFCWWCCFLISCWGAVFDASADVVYLVVLLGMNWLKIWPIDSQLSKAWLFSLAASVETNYVWWGLCNFEAEKQPLLGNGSYTCSRGTRHIRCDVMQ
jgi:hypothetical protein